MPARTLRGPRQYTRLRVTNNLFLHHFHEMSDFGNHAARLRRIDQFGDAADLVELEPDQRLALAEMAPHRTAGLANFDGLAAILAAVLAGIFTARLFRAHRML